MVEFFRVIPLYLYVFFLWCSNLIPYWPCCPQVFYWGRLWNDVFNLDCRRVETYLMIEYYHFRFVWIWLKPPFMEPSSQVVSLSMYSCEPCMHFCKVFSCEITIVSSTYCRRYWDWLGSLQMSLVAVYYIRTGRVVSLWCALIWGKPRRGRFIYFDC